MGGGVLTGGSVRERMLPCKRFIFFDILWGLSVIIVLYLPSQTEMMPATGSFRSGKEIGQVDCRLEKRKERKGGGEGEKKHKKNSSEREGKQRLSYRVDSGVRYRQ